MTLLSSSPMAMLQSRPVNTLLLSSPIRIQRSSANLPRTTTARSCLGTKCFFNPFEDQPIIKEALKEPVAFAGGVFAGLLRLDLNEDPLKEWINRTVEASGFAAEVEMDAAELRVGGDDEPQQIEIE